MDFGQKLWSEYLQRFAPCDAPLAIDRLRPEAVAKLIWPLSDVIRDRSAFLRDVTPREEFDEEADSALSALAATGDFACWDKISAGAWATLINRFKWSVTALMLEEQNPAAFSVPLPHDAPEGVRQIAAFLLILGGVGRNPSEAWRRAQAEQRPEFSLNWPLSPQ